MSSESFSSKLAYPDIKKRAVASRAFKTRISPSNGQTFSLGSGTPIRFDLAGNLTGRFYDFSQMYLKLTATPSAACKLDRCGAYGFIKRLQISTGGSVISDLNNFNVLATALLDTEASPDFMASTGNILLGTVGDALTGESLANARTFCLPIISNPLSLTTPHRFIPAFSKSPIVMEFSLEQAATALISAAAVTCDITEVELVCNMVELSPAAMAELNSRTGGQFNFLALSWSNSTAILTAGASALTATLGFSMSSLERIMVIHRPSAHIAATAKYSLGNRGHANLTQYSFQINGESYPQVPIKRQAKSAESYAELLLAGHQLGAFRTGNMLQSGVARASHPLFLVGPLSSSDPAVAKSDPFNLVGADAGGALIGTSGRGSGSGADPANATAVASDIGTFIAAVELESGLSHGQSSHIYSGVSTVASTMQYLGQYANPPNAYVVDFFAQNTVIVGLNMQGSGVFQVSV